MKRYTALQQGLILLAMATMAHSVHATGSQQSWIDTDCFSLYSLNMTIANQRDCSAANAGHQFLGGYQLEYSVARYSYIISTRLNYAIIGASALSIMSGSDPSSFSDNGTPAAAGHNAGEQFGNIGVWGNFSHSNLSDDFINTPFDSNSRSGIVGADILLNDSTVVGAAFGYDDSDVDTPFNGGHQHVTGYTLTGYAASTLGSHFTVDANFGYANHDTDQTRIVSGFEAAVPFGLGAAGAGAVASSNVNADRWFGAINLNGNWNINNVLLNAHGGYLYADEDFDADTESAATVGTGAIVTTALGSQHFVLGQFRVGGELSYDYHSILEPYLGIDYLYNNTRDQIAVGPGLSQPSNDRDELQYSLGMRYFGDNGLSGTVEYTVSGSKRHMNYNAFMLTLRADL